VIESINTRLDQHGKLLEHLQAGQERMEKTQQEQSAALTRLEQGQAQHKTLVKVLEAGQNDIRENMATKADVQDIKAEQGKLKRRIENVEESTKTPNPHKN
jgi:uncharacterized phage infection (PIP) family protein YhgE